MLASLASQHRERHLAQQHVNVITAFAWYSVIQHVPRSRSTCDHSSLTCPQQSDLAAKEVLALACALVLQLDQVRPAIELDDATLPPGLANFDALHSDPIPVPAACGPENDI